MTAIAPEWLDSLQSLHSTILQCQEAAEVEADAETPTEAYQDILRLCETILQQNSIPPSIYETILQVQSTALLHLEDFGRVVETKSTTTNSLKAYALYRQGKHASAASLLSASSSNLLEQHILAQSMYRSNDTSAAIQRYSAMLQKNKNSHTPEQMELLTNATALLSSNVTPIPTTTTTSSSKDSDDQIIATMAQEYMRIVDSDHKGEYPYDLAYNLGTYKLLTDSNVENSRALLRTAHDHTITDTEKAMIQTNLACCTQISTGVQDYPSIKMTNKNKQVATIVQLNTQQQTTLQQQQLELLSPLQRRMYHYNRAILALKNNNVDVCKEACQTLLASMTTTTNKKGLFLAPTRSLSDEQWWKTQVTVIQAHLLLLQQGAKLEDALQLLDQQLQKLPPPGCDDMIDHAITTILLHKSTLQTTTAKDQLDTLLQLPPSMLSKPGVIATMAHLYQQLGQHDKAQELLKKDSAFLIQYYISQGMYTQACALLESQNDIQSQVQHVNVLLQMGQVTKATTLWNTLQLDPPSILSTTCNGQDLEMAPLPKIHKSTTLLTMTATTNKKKKSKESILRRRAKLRDALVLKNSANKTTVVVDPERWIPKAERSGRKNNRRNRINNQGAGGNEKDAAKLDVAARGGTAASSSGPSTANMVVSTSETKRVSGRKKR